MRLKIYDLIQYNALKYNYDYTKIRLTTPYDIKSERSWLTLTLTMRSAAGGSWGLTSTYSLTSRKRPSLDGPHFLVRIIITATIVLLKYRTMKFSGSPLPLPSRKWTFKPCFLDCPNPRWRRKSKSTSHYNNCMIFTQCDSPLCPFVSIKHLQKKTNADFFFWEMMLVN